MTDQAQLRQLLAKLVGLGSVGHEALKTLEAIAAGSPVVEARLSLIARAALADPEVRQALDPEDLALLATLV